MLLNATTLEIFNSNVIFFVLGSALAISLMLVITNMKDVVQEKKASTLPAMDSNQSSRRAMFAIKQGFKLIFTEPLIFFGIWGSVIQMNLKMIAGMTSNLAI